LRRNKSSRVARTRTTRYAMTDAAAACTLTG